MIHIKIKQWYKTKDGETLLRYVMDGRDPVTNSPYYRIEDYRHSMVIYSGITAKVAKQIIKETCDYGKE